MKLSGRNIRHRLYGLTRLGDKLSRARYFRGHSVHSPFVYGMVRKVFMKSTVSENADTAFIDALRAKGLNARRSTQIHNTMRYCEASTWSIDSCDAEFCVFTPATSDEQTKRAYDTCRNNGHIFVVALPYSSSSRCTLFRMMIERHDGTAIDNRGFIIFMNNDLPKQHFRL